MKNLLIGFIIGVILGSIITYQLKKCDTKPVTKTITVEVEIPAVKDSFPYEVPVPYPVPTPNPINAELKAQLDSAKTALDSLRTYKLFAVKRNYKETFKDENLSITVDAETTGTLDILGVKYEIEAKTIKVDKEVIFDIPDNRSLTIYLEGGLPLKQYSEASPVIAKPGFDWTTKKNWVYGGSYSTDGRLWFKTGKKFDF